MEIEKALLKIERDIKILSLIKMNLNGKDVPKDLDISLIFNELNDLPDLEVSVEKYFERLNFTQIQVKVSEDVSGDFQSSKAEEVPQRSQDELILEFIKSREGFVKLNLDRKNFKDKDLMFLIPVFNSNINIFFDKIINSREKDKKFILKKFLFASIIIKEFVTKINEEILSYISESFKNVDNFLLDYFNNYLNFLIKELKDFEVDLGTDEEELENKILSLNYLDSVIRFGLNNFNKYLKEVINLKEEKQLFVELFDLDDVKKIIFANRGEELSNISSAEIGAFKPKFKSKFFEDFIVMLFSKHSYLSGNDRTLDVYYNFRKYLYVYNKLLNNNLNGEEIIVEDLEPVTQKVFSQKVGVSEDLSQSNSDDTGALYDPSYLDHGINKFIGKLRSRFPILSSNVESIDENSQEYKNLITELDLIEFKNKEMNNILPYLRANVVTLTNITFEELRILIDVIKHLELFLKNNFNSLIAFRFQSESDKPKRYISLFRTLVLLSLKLSQKNTSLTLETFISNNFGKFFDKVCKSIK